MSNINVSKIQELIDPILLIHKYKITEELKIQINKWRSTVANIISEKDHRKLLILGPCSIHNVDEAIDYAKHLKPIIDKYSDKIFIVMRVYFEKPRTTIGWKGLINDPDLDYTYNINKGLDLSRKLLLDINSMGIPVGCEFLDTISPQYIADLVTWGAIGARTTESQVHRQLASGLSMPIGFKNGTGGSIDIAVDAITSAKSEHVFLGVNQNSKASIIKTKGNLNCHIILRGGKNEPNYYEKNVLYTCKLLQSNNHTQRVMIDCSHGNSRKFFKNQITVLENIITQLKNNNIFGIMIESNINEGKQSISENLKYGVSVTDGCLGLPDTEICLNMLYEEL